MVARLGLWAITPALGDFIFFRRFLFKEDWVVREFPWQQHFFVEAINIVESERSLS